MSRPLLIALATAALPILAATAEDRIADIRQGTNLSVALAPGGDTLVIDLLGQLWTLPATGGGAVPITPSGEHARNPRISPDGKQVVYQRRIDEQWDLWLLDLTTGEQQALTTSRYDEREPDFTPDGRSVVFATNRTGHFCLWSIALGNRVQTQLTEERGNASLPTVSEHGLVAYLRLDGEQWSIRVLGSDGAAAQVYTSVQRLSALSWRPGGGVLVFGEQDSPESSRLQMLLLAEPRVQKSLSRSEDLFGTRPAWLSAAEFVYAADGQLWRRGIATPTREPVHLFAASAVEVAATPTEHTSLDAAGDRVALGINGVAHSPDGRVTAFTALGDLWLAERSAPQRLTNDAFADLDPAFWPDGESLVFASERTGQLELWRLALRDKRLTQLTFGALQPRRPAVRPGGSAIAYLESASLEASATTNLKVLDWPSGREATVATRLVDASLLTWSSDGRTLTVRARSADNANPTARDFRVDLSADPAPAPAEAGGELPRITWQIPAPPDDYVVEIGRLFDGVQGTYRRHVDMHVRGGRIAAVVGRGVLPAAGRVVDARDATVIPGLIDVHAHQSALVGERLGRAWLAYGVTTVREVTTAPAEALERAEAWGSARLAGPRLVVSPADDASAALVGADLPRYPGIAHGLAHSLRRQTAELAIPTLPAYPARLNSELASQRVELELSPGFTAYQDGLSRLIASGSTFVTGLAPLAGMQGFTTARTRDDKAYRALFTAAERAQWERPETLGAIVPALQRTVARLVRGGGRVAVGSDAPAVPYGFGVHLELALLAGAGMANDHVLRMATTQGALALGLEQQIGTLEEGKLADFVVLDGDPLTTIADTLRIVATVKGGHWYARESLLAPQ